LRTLCGRPGDSTVYQGDTYLIAANPHDQWVTQTFELERGGEQSIEVLFEDRRTRLVRGRFTDLFTAFAVHIYLISPRP